MKFEKRSQFFVGGDDESLSVVAVCISNEDSLSVGIDSCDAAPTPTGFAEIVSDDFPELHVDRIVPLLVSTQQSQNDIKEPHSNLVVDDAVCARRELCSAAAKYVSFSAKVRSPLLARSAGARPVNSTEPSPRTFTPDAFRNLRSSERHEALILP